MDVRRAFPARSRPTPVPPMPTPETAASSALTALSHLAVGCRNAAQAWDNSPQSAADAKALRDGVYSVLNTTPPTPPPTTLSGASNLDAFFTVGAVVSVAGTSFNETRIL